MDPPIKLGSRFTGIRTNQEIYERIMINTPGFHDGQQFLSGINHHLSGLNLTPVVQLNYLLNSIHWLLNAAGAFQQTQPVVQ